jgi:hypothetical protein
MMEAVCKWQHSISTGDSYKQQRDDLADHSQSGSYDGQNYFKIYRPEKAGLCYDQQQAE